MRDVLSGTIPMLPKVKVPFVDVRDVAAGHVAALTKGVPGQRYLLVGETIWLNDVGPKILAPVYKPKGFKVTEGTAPGFIVWLLSFLDRCERGLCLCLRLRLVPLSVRRHAAAGRAAKPRPAAWQHAVGGRGDAAHRLHDVRQEGGDGPGHQVPVRAPPAPPQRAPGASATDNGV